MHGLWKTETSSRIFSRQSQWDFLCLTGSNSILKFAENIHIFNMKYTCIKDTYLTRFISLVVVVVSRVEVSERRAVDSSANRFSFSLSKVRTFFYIFLLPFFKPAFLLLSLSLPSLQIRFGPNSARFSRENRSLEAPPHPRRRPHVT